MKCVVLSIFIFASMFASAETVAIIYSAKNKFSTEIVKSIRRDLRKKSFNIIDCSYSSKIEYKNVERKINSIEPDFLLSFGKVSTKLADSIGLPGIFAMTINSFSLGLFDKDMMPLKNMTGIVMNTDPLTQIDYIQRVMALPRGIGIVYNPKTSQFIANKYQSECEKRNILLHAYECASEENLISTFNNNKAKADCFVSLLDPTVYSMKNMIALLKFVTINKIPAIGISPKLVESGMLMSTSIDKKTIHSQIVDIMTRMQNGEDVSQIKVQFPEEVELCINKKMEKNYNVKFAEVIQKEAIVVE